MAEMTRYRCEKGHVVGLVKHEGHGVSSLLYFRQSIDEGDEIPEEPEIAAVVYSGDVNCSICQKSMVWVPTAPTLEKILRSHRKLMVRMRIVEAAMENPGFGG